MNGFALPICQRVIERGFARIPLKRVINIVSAEKPPNISAQEPLRLHSGRIEDIDWNMIPPLDEEVIEAMRPCESVFMEMMNRLEGKGRVVPFRARKREYLRHLRYWHAFLEEEQIDLFVSLGFPHRMRTWVIASLCRYKSIPAFYFQHTSPIPSLFYLSRHWEESVIGLRERFAELQKNPPSGDAPLPPVLERYFRAQAGQEGDPAPWFVHSPPPAPAEEWRVRAWKLLRGKWRGIIRQGILSLGRRFTFDYWSRFLRDRKRRRSARTMFRFYDVHASAPDLSKRYIYLPLQLQPELTTCPLAGAYVDQSLIAAMLGAFLPEDVFIYVKEHPNQERLFPDGMSRSLSSYERLLALPNVRLVPRTFDTFTLMEHAIAVATATGSAGFEGLFRGKPFLMFGHDYYQFAPGVFPIRTSEDCKNALQAVLEGGAKPRLSDMRLFLHALGDVTVPGYLSPDTEEVTVVSEKECVENLGGLLERRIRETFV